MPELPEVETVRRGLAPVLEGARLLHVEARRPDLRFPLPERFAARLTGATVLRLERRAKYLNAALDTGETLIMHLGMSGRFTVAENMLGRFVHGGAPHAAHDHVVFDTATARVTFNDARRFGFMTLADTARIAEHPFFAGLGPEPLGRDFTAADLARRAAGRKTPLKAFLLDQRTVAGLGNIYVCEALFAARLSPLSLAASLTPAAARRLAAAVPAVLRRAISAGGSSLRDYRQAGGDMGRFQHEFCVYGRAGQPCPACGRPILRIVQSGRSTFYCPRDQRIRHARPDPDRAPRRRAAAAAEPPGSAERPVRRAGRAAQRGA